jgi:hypothetical protein
MLDIPVLYFLVLSFLKTKKVAPGLEFSANENFILSKNAIIKDPD